MKDVQGMLRRIDEEITGREQQIAMHQVEIARLVTTRRTIMGIAEDDIAAAETAKMERVGRINGTHAKPLLIVRKAGTGEEVKLSKRGKVKKAGDRRGGKRKWRSPEEVAAFEKSISKTLVGRTLKAAEIADHLGIDVKQVDQRKTVQNTLYRMEKRGMVKHVEDGWQQA